MKYLVCADGSESSFKALDKALEFANDNTDEIFILHATKYIADIYAEHVVIPQDELRESEMKKGKEIVKRYLQKMHDSKVKRTGHVVMGDPRSDIIDYADEQQIDMILCGARGLGAIKRLLLGSVSTHLVQNANCSVLVVKERQPQQK